MEARELALELALELGREPSGTRDTARDVMIRASSDMSDVALDVGGFFPNCPLGSRGWEAEGCGFLILSSMYALADTPGSTNVSNTNLSMRLPAQARWMGYGGS